LLLDCIAKKAHFAAFQLLTIEYMHTLPLTLQKTTHLQVTIIVPTNFSGY